MDGCMKNYTKTWNTEYLLGSGFLTAVGTVTYQCVQGGIESVTVTAFNGLLVAVGALILHIRGKKLNHGGE